MTILTVNAGSSSIRLAIYTRDARLSRIGAVHHADAIVDPEARLRMFLQQYSGLDITVVAHRVVHGGAKLTRPCVIDTEVKAEIESLTALAPLHNPVALRWIEACEEVFGRNVPQVAAFDTGFYATLPEVARRYPLPRSLCDRYELQRYGFHGLAHEAMWRRWCALHPQGIDAGRVISLQLGAGCSITAVRHGKPIDTSMGFTPLEGLMMATRSGDVDPGLLTFVQRAEMLTVDQMETLLTRESGLLGVAGDADMKALLARDDADARLAIDIYCYRARKYIGAYFAALGAVDAILFSGGVGERAPSIRAAILADLESLDIAIDADANREAIGIEARISRGDGPVAVWVIPADEADVLARAALVLVPVRIR